MFISELNAATKQLNKRSITFKVNKGFFSPDLLQDKHTLELAGFKNVYGNEQWFSNLIDSEEFSKHFDQHTLIDWDNICPDETPAPSSLMNHIWNAFTY